jgi:hypothetical protein
MYSLPSSEFYGDKVGDLHEVILEALRTGPLTRTEINGLFSRNKSATHIVPALRHVLDSGRVKVEREATAGRPVEIWSLKVT